MRRLWDLDTLFIFLIVFIIHTKRHLIWKKYFWKNLKPMTVFINSPRSTLGHRDAVTSSLKSARSLAWFWPLGWLQVPWITSEWCPYGDISHPSSESWNRLLWNGKTPRAWPEQQENTPWWGVKVMKRRRLHALVTHLLLRKEGETDIYEDSAEGGLGLQSRV